MHKNTLFNTLIAGTLILLGSCTIDEVHQQTEGSLYFRAQNVNDALEAVPGRLYSGVTLLGQFNQNYLEITMPLDSVMTLSFQPELEENWFPPQDQLWEFPAGQDVDTLLVEMLAVDDELLSVMMVSMTEHGEIEGMPFRLDGEEWPVPTPTMIQFTALNVHEVSFGSEACPRGSQTFVFNEQPEGVLELEVAPHIMSWFADGEYDFIFQERNVGTLVLDMTPAIQDYFLSAFKQGDTGYATRPSSYSFDMLCPFTPNFSFDAVDLGYQPGTIFPDFTLTEVEPGLASSEQDPDAELSLHQMRGRITLVSFWFIDCPACQEEMPHFEELLHEYEDDGFRILTLNPVPSDDPEYYPVYDFHYLLDTNTPPVAQQASIGAFPTNFIVQPDGVIHSRNGALSHEALEAIILELRDEFSDGLPD